MLAPWALWCWSRWWRSLDREPVFPLVDKQGDCIPSCGQTRSPPAVWIFITLNMMRDQPIVALTKKLCRQLLLILGFMAFTAQVSWLQQSKRNRKKRLLYNIQCVFLNTLFQVFLTVALQLEEANKVMILFLDKILQICSWKHFRWVFWGKVGTSSLLSSSKSSYSKYYQTYWIYQEN